MVDLLTREYEVNYSHIDNRGIATVLIGSTSF